MDFRYTQWPWGSPFWPIPMYTFYLRCNLLGTRLVGQVFSGSLLLQSLGIHFLQFFGIPGTVWKVSISSKWQFWWGKRHYPIGISGILFSKKPTWMVVLAISNHELTTRESGRFFTTIVSARQLYPPRQSCRQVWDLQSLLQSGD